MPARNMRWMARTLADELEEQKRSRPEKTLQDRADLEPVETGMDRAKIKCPRCNIPKNPFQLTDVRALPWSSWTYICDGCRYDVVRKGLTTHSDMARGLGASEDHAQFIAEKEWTQSQR